MLWPVAPLHCSVLTKPDIAPAGKGEMLQGPDPASQSRVRRVDLELGGSKLITGTITGDNWQLYLEDIRRPSDYFEN